MAVSRRKFLVSAGAAALITARGHEAWAQAAVESSGNAPFAPGKSQHLILDSNENPLGPGQHVIDAVLDAIGDDGAGAGRYMFAQQGTTRQAIADAMHLQRDNILPGAGSTELLRLAVEVFTAKHRALVTADPSFAAGEHFAGLLKHPVKKIRLDAHLRVDLDAMREAANGAGLVYLCNPNNPTATIHSASDLKAFIEDVLAASPETRILIDEAYYDYVVDDSYASMLDLLGEHPQLIVARTFSKAYGMAGLRLGFLAAQAATIGELSRVRGMDMYTSYPARAGGIAALGNMQHIEQERTRNYDVRKFTQAYFARAGLRHAASHANFIFFDAGQPGAKFQQSCLDRGVKIRSGYADYPNYARVSLGTMEEMQYATEVITALL